MKHLKRILSLALLAASLFAIALPSEALAGLKVGDTGIVSVNSAGLNIRKTASTSDGTYWNVGNGTEVEITSVPNSTWYGVTVTKYVKGSYGTGYVGLKGYAMASYISPGSTTNPPNPTTPPTSGTLRFGFANLSSGFVYIRSQPNGSASTLGQLEKREPLLYRDTKLNSTGSDGLQWYKIEKPIAGYVAAKYVGSGGNAGGSSEGSRAPYCVSCQSQMFADRVVSGTRTYVDGNVNSNGQLRSWYGLRLRVSYTCASHPTGSSTIIDGPGVNGWCWAENINSVSTYTIGTPPKS